MDSFLSRNPNDKMRLNSAPNSVGGADFWIGLQKFTSARIAIGRAGGSQRTPSILDFRLAHALARDAVHAVFYPEKIAHDLKEAGFESVVLRTMIDDKPAYLMKPDLGRKLCEQSRQELKKIVEKYGRKDFAIVISDGLSATAALNHSVKMVSMLMENMPSKDWSMYPVIIAPFARVKIQDDINEILGARHTLVLIGERPGLGSPDSLSAYFTYKSKWASVESDRNCISNIRPLGMPLEIAAKKLSILLKESLRLKISGTALKDNIDQSAILDADIPNKKLADKGVI